MDDFGNRYGVDLRDEIENKLKDLNLDNKQLCQFAWLCGVRALPFLGGERHFDYWNEKDKQKHLCSIFYALDTCAQAAFLDDFMDSKVRNEAKADNAYSQISKDSKARAKAVITTHSDAFDAVIAIESFAEIAKTATYAIVNFTRAIKHIAYAVSSGQTEISYDASDAIISAIAGLRNAAILYKAFKNDRDFLEFLFKDFEIIKEDRLDKCNHDIDLYDKLWGNFQEDLKAAGCEYWAELYKDLFRNGFDKLDKEELKRRLSVPYEIRAEGAAEVGRHLSVFIIKRTPEKEKEKQTKIMSALKDKYKYNDLTLVLGSGVSIDSGMPSWDKLVKKLLVKMINEKLKNKNESYSNEDMNTIIESVYKNDSPLAQIRYIRNIYGNASYNKIIRTIFYENDPKINTPLLTEIANLCIQREGRFGIKSIITYNFDDLLERTFEHKINYKSIHEEIDTSDIKSLNIYHVHGYLPKSSENLNTDINLVFSEEDYHRMYKDIYCWSNIIQLNSFRETTCLFIGFSFTDPNLKRLIDSAKRIGEIRHYAIMKRRSIEDKEFTDVKCEALDEYISKDNLIREEYLRSLGINVIWVDDYDEIPRILSELRKS